MASDAELFHQRDELPAKDFNGWSYEGETEYLPLYEAKMLGHFDHRFSTYQDATQAQLNAGSLPRPTSKQHDDPLMEPLARYWVAQPEVANALSGKWEQDWLLGWRNIARASDVRTFVPSVLPASAVGHAFPLAFPVHPAHGPLLHAVWSTMAFDYVARQKISGSNMKYSSSSNSRARPRTSSPMRPAGSLIAPLQNGSSRTYWNCRTRRGGFSLTPGRWATTARRSGGILTGGHFCGLTLTPRCSTFTASPVSRPSTSSTPSPSCASTRSETTASTEPGALSSKPTTA